MTENSDIKPEDGSIETVLSSIRRILKEGKEAKPAAAAAAPAAPPVTPPAAQPAAAQPAAAQPAATQAAVPAPVQDSLVEENMDDPEDDEDSVLVLDSSMMATDDEDEHPEEPHAEEPHPEAGHGETGHGETGHGDAGHAAESRMENARPEHDHARDTHAETHHAEEEEDEPFLDEHEFHEAEAARQKHEAEHGTTAAGEAPPLVLDAAAPVPHHDATPALPAAAAAPAVTAPPAISAPETASASHAGAVETVQTPLQETAHTPGTPARKKWSVPTTLSGVTMSEDRDASETQNYPAGYTAGGAASDTDAPAPVQIPLDKQTIGATEHSFGALQQMLRRKQSVEHRERRVAITRGGNLTIEDIVRDEVRAFLKEWLDQHLSGIVQQAVQKEIERLSDR